MAKIQKIAASIPGVESVTSVSGFSLLSLVRTSYNAFAFISMKEWGNRKTRAEQFQAIKARLNAELAKLPESVAFGFSPPAIPGVGTSGGFTFILEDRSGGDVKFLSDNLNKFMAAARKRPEIGSLSTTFLPSVPQQFVTVDRDKVIKQGVAINDVYRTIQAFMGGLFVNYFNRFGRQWQVYVEAEGDYRTKSENVGQFYVRNASGEMVPLSALTKFESRSGPEFTMRFNEYRAAQLNGGAAPGYSTNQAMKALEETFAQTMPVEMGFDYSGMSFQEKKAQEGVSSSVIFGFSLLFVFLILAALYESWSLPFSVLLSTPVAVFGAFAFLWLRRTLLGYFVPAYMVQIENDVYSQIGLVMLIGLAAKNAILIVEFARDEFEKGKPLAEAALEGARLRLRPILMTSFAFILGCVPLWTASGAGAVARQIMGTTVIGGMVAASGIGIFLVPAIFYLVEKVSGAAASQSAPLTSATALAWRGRLTHAPANVPDPDCEPLRRVARSVRTTNVPRLRFPASFRAPAPLPPGQAASFADLKWFEVFQDEKLQELIRTALERNYDLRDAVARVEEARASLGITRSNQFPNVGAGGSVEINRFSRDGATPLPPQILPSQNRSFGQAVLQLLSFEIDIWGRLRRATEAARANLLGAEENRKAVVTTLVSDVATAYLTLRELDYALEISQAHSANARGVARIDQVAAEGRRLHTSRPAAGRTTGRYRRRDHPRHTTADRADRESDQAIARRKPGQCGARAEPGRPEAAAGRSRRHALGVAGAPSRYPGRGAGSDRRQRRNRRRQGGLLPAIEPQRIPGWTKHAIVESVQRSAQRVEPDAAGYAADLHRRTHQIQCATGSGRERPGAGAV